MADAKPGDCRNGNHVSEGQIVLWYHIFREQIRELCTGERKGTEILSKPIFPPNKLQKYAHIKEVQMHENEKVIMPLVSISDRENGMAQTEPEKCLEQTRTPVNPGSRNPSSVFSPK